MKKFFRNACVRNSDDLISFGFVCVLLYIAWQLIMSGSLFAQILAVVIVLYFVITALIGAVLILVDVIRKIAEKKKEFSTHRSEC